MCLQMNAWNEKVTIADGIIITLVLHAVLITVKCTVWLKKSEVRELRGAERRAEIFGYNLKFHAFPVRHCQNHWTGW